MEDIIDIIVTETTNLIEITSQPTDEIIDVNIIDNREDVTLNVTPTVVEININSLTGNFGINWGEITGTLSNQTDLNTALGLKADLVGGKVPSSQLPSYVDDVVEVANYAALPTTGETGKIYVTIDTNYIYRWTGSVYVEIKDSSAVWGAITGTLSNQTDLQNALNLKANDNAVVHLAGTETITGAKTFSSAVTAPNFILSGGTGNTGLYYGHTDRVVLANYTAGGIDFEVNGGSIVATLFPSGNYGLGITLDAGYKLDVNGTARISGALSGTSASFSSSITASSIIKSGGTSSQFLKADGSIDSNIYLTTSSAASTYVPYTGANSAVNLGAYDLTVNGIKVGRGAGSISDNTVVGASALTSNTTGSSNTAIGFSALGANTIAGGNTAIGTYALSANISGGTNTAIGYSAGSSITTGSNNVIIGGYAGTSSMSGNVILSDGGGNIRFQYNGTNTLLGQSGNVLINTTTDSGYKLDVNGTGRFSGAYVSFNNNGYIRGDATGWLSLQGGTNGTRVRDAGNSTTYFSIAESTGAAMFSSGVTAASATFSGNISMQAPTGVGTFISFKNDSNTSGFDIGHLNGAGAGAYIYQRASQPIIFGTNNAEIVRFLANGNVGIGTTSPQVRFEVAGLNGNIRIYGQSGLTQNGISSNVYYNGTSWVRDNSFYGAGAIRFDSDASSIVFNTDATTSGFPAERMRITSGGDFLVGKTAKDYTSAGSQFEQAGKIFGVTSGIASENIFLNKISSQTGNFINFLYNSGSVGTISTNGTTTSYNITSDYRLKEDLKSINGLEIVNKIKVYDYKWKSDNSRMDGVLAHELQEVLPYAVQGVKDGEQMQSVDYSKIVPVMVQAIKDLKAELDTLKNK